MGKSLSYKYTKQDTRENEAPLSGQKALHLPPRVRKTTSATVHIAHTPTSKFCGGLMRELPSAVCFHWCNIPIHTKTKSKSQVNAGEAIREDVKF